MFRTPTVFVAFLLYATLLATLTGCDTRTRLPDKGSSEYRDAVSAFYVGLAALQVGDDTRADKTLAELTRLAPGEPAGWANWGILALRQRDFDAAAQRLERARALSPADGHVDRLLGFLNSNRGQSAAAIDHFKKAVDRDPADLRGRFAFAQEVERQGGKDGDLQFQQSIERILDVDRDNLAAELELCRIAAKRGDAVALKKAVASLDARASAWPIEAREQFAKLKTAANGNDLRAAATQSTLLRNVLWRVPEFRRSYAKLKAPAGEELEPFTRPVRIESPAFAPAPADMAISFDSQAIAALSGGPWDWAGAIQLGSAGSPIAAVANGNELRLANGTTLSFPGGASNLSPSPEGVLQLDFNYDFKTDLALVGAGGIRLFRQESPTQFTDVTRETKLPEPVLNGRYTGAWAVDIESDGDLDIVLGAREGQPTVLRNNGDGTFAVLNPFAGISGLRQFAWIDIDGDGEPDVAIIDGAGRLHIFANDRQGQFRERQLDASFGIVKAIAVTDVDNDGALDLVAVRADGAIVRISYKNEGRDFEIAEIARVPDPTVNLAGDLRLHAADLDNNGAADLFLTSTDIEKSGALVWLADERNKLTLLDRRLGPRRVFDAANLSGNGKLDFIGLADDGQPIHARNASTKDYHWQIVRPHAAQAFGDQRINPFGVGGEVEIRAGFIAQTQPIMGPQVHFGLGTQTRTDVIRVIWPNGAVRAEFDVKPDQDVETEQRLKGSCPFLFAFDGKQMAFVKDAVPWGSAIGLRINTLGSASIAATEEWYKIARNELVPHDGYYDLRFTAELWEVYYYDHLALFTVDHPPGTEIFVDERFVIPPARLAITAVESPHKIARAIDDEGHDVTEVLAKLDGRALNNFGPGQYQGVTRDHYVEVDLGDDVPQSGPLYLIAHGSIYPTDSSINVALSQGERWRAHGLSLEVPDGRGGWIVANENLGFPAGRKKTMLVDLTNVFRPGTPRRVRLRTNLEIYWDAIEWARGLPDTAIKTTRLDPAYADLHYRGYSVIERPDSASPELPDYNRLSGTKQRWRDLIGYYTRYGDVRELLANADDRYVIMNSGDEMSLRFAEQPSPPAGWLRDFVITGDGWIKDGDYNSTFSKTVQPLPYHAERDYTTPPGRLEDERVYREHPEDWQNYHTRYVTPDVFNHALRAAGSQ